MPADANGSFSSSSQRWELDALEEVERTDFMYPTTQRVVALVTLGRVAAAEADLEAARAAFQQALAHIKGRPRMTAGGPLTIRALAHSPK